MKKKFTAKDKARIALEALTESDTLATISSKNKAHAIQVGLWKKKAKENMYLLFEKENSEAEKIKTLEKQVDELHRIIGTRDEELAWLKKKSAS
jgi:transposase-like protein